MVNQTTPTNQLVTPKLVNTIQQLSSSLSAIQPSDNRTTRLITYALVGTVVAGLVVYHYIREQEAN